MLLRLLLGSKLSLLVPFFLSRDSRIGALEQRHVLTPRCQCAGSSFGTRGVYWSWNQ
jgi:hypothetical protein